MTIIIGLLGPAGAGKTTAGEYLGQRYGAVRYAFADPLKEIVRLALQLSDSQVYGTQEQKNAIDQRYGRSARWFVRRIGTEGVQAVFGKRFWANHTLTQIATEAPAIAVIEDVRFIHEADAIRELGGYVWRLEPIDDDPNDDHRSETEWRQCAYNYHIAPAFKDLNLLHQLLDDAAHSVKLFPVQRDVSL